jgi:hypothetical protein
MKSKKSIKQSIKSYDRLIEEHEDKKEKHGHEQPWLKGYWDSQIEELEKQKRREQKKLEK